MAELDTFIQQLKDRLAIDEVVGRTVALTRKGNRLWGLCPFHAEKTPSFTVKPDDGFFKCFGCGKGGAHITFVREPEGLSFPETLRLLADLSGMDLPEGLFKGERTDPNVREMAREALAVARRSYEEALRSPEAEGAREYLKGRGVSGEMAKCFGLGWAPRERGWLSRIFQQKKVTLEGAIAAGLMFEPDGGGAPKDRFWERLMFPVRDSGGRTLGFSARYLPGSFAQEKGMGKYVNSPEGPLFPKRRVLYGIDLLPQGLRDRPDLPLILCEGQLDVLLLHQAGLVTTVAALGTAFTTDHARRVKRLLDGRTAEGVPKHIVLLLDSDIAGRKAAAAAGRILIAEGVDVRVSLLPDGADPADMITSGETEELLQRVTDSRDILEWRLQAWVQKGDFGIPAVVNRAAEEAAEWISTTLSPVLAEGWLRMASNQLGVSEQALRHMIRSDSGSHPVPQQSRGGHPSSSLNPSAENLVQNEREIVAALLSDPSAWPLYREILDSLEFSDSIAQKVFLWCKECRQSGKMSGLELAMLAFSDDGVLAWLDEIRLLVFPDPARALERSLAALPANRERAVNETRTTNTESITDDELRALQRKITFHPDDEIL